MHRLRSHPQQSRQLARNQPNKGSTMMLFVAALWVSRQCCLGRGKNALGSSCCWGCSSVVLFSQKLAASLACKSPLPMHPLHAKNSTFPHASECSTVYLCDISVLIFCWNLQQREDRILISAIRMRNRGNGLDTGPGSPPALALCHPTFAPVASGSSSSSKWATSVAAGGPSLSLSLYHF